MIFLFAILECVPFQPEKCFWKRWFQKIPEPQIERVAVRGGSYFYVVKVFLDKYGEFDEELLRNSIGNAIYRVILKKGSSLPQNTTLKEFKPTLYPTLLFLHMALDYVKEKESEKRERSLGVRDEDAKLLENILPFAPFAKSILVYTKNETAYEETAQKMLGYYGLPLQLTEDEQKLKTCSILLEPFSKDNGKSRGILHLQRGMRDSFCGEDISLPMELLKRCPENIDQVLFASALYEICNVKSLENLSYAHRKRIKAL